MYDLAILPFPNGDLSGLVVVAVLEGDVHVPLGETQIAIDGRTFDASVVP